MQVLDNCTWRVLFQIAKQDSPWRQAVISSLFTQKPKPSRSFLYDSQVDPPEKQATLNSTVHDHLAAILSLTRSPPSRRTTPLPAAMSCVKSLPRLIMGSCIQFRMRLSHRGWGINQSRTTFYLATLLTRSDIMQSLRFARSVRTWKCWKMEVRLKLVRGEPFVGPSLQNQEWWYPWSGV